MDPAPTEIYSLSLHDALPILSCELSKPSGAGGDGPAAAIFERLLEWTAGQFRELGRRDGRDLAEAMVAGIQGGALRSEEHTSELQSRRDLVCRLLLEKKKKKR